MRKRQVATCTHPKARHRHGTVPMYVRDKCGCAPCTAAATRYSKLRELRARNGMTPAGWVDAAPVRAHVLWLRSQGVALKTITKEAGAGGGLLGDLMYGRPMPDGTRRVPSRRVNGATALRILAVKPSLRLQPDRALVDGTGARRRLQALMCLGWSQSQLATRIGVTPTNFGRTINGQQKVIASTARAAVELYEQLWDTPAPETSHREKIAAARSRRYARERRWRPPMFWDDDLIDVPRTRRKRPDEELMPCGTPAAYRRHLRRGEEPDRACRDEWTRQRAAERQEAA